MTGRIDAAIDRLDAALRAAGFRGLAAAAEPELLAEIGTELAPYALPVDLQRFWERAQLAGPLDPTMPEACDPYGALAAHRLNVDEFPGVFGPPILFPIARKSESQWSIELAGPGGPGGPIVSHDALVSVRVEYASFTDLVEVYAELVEDGCFELLPDGHAFFGRDALLERQEERLQAAGVAERTIHLEPEAMPAHWLASAGIDLADREPRGTTHTIAELARASARAPLHATIAGRVWNLGGVGSELLVVVDDASGTVEVWCPPGLSPWFPGRGGDRFELDVDVTRRILTSVRLAGVRSAVAGAEPSASMERLSVDHRAVVATAIRPLG